MPRALPRQRRTGRSSASSTACATTAPACGSPTPTASPPRWPRRAPRAGVERIAVPPGFPDDWRPPGIEVVVDEGLTPAELEAIGAAATAAALGIAETGTVVLDAGEGQGRRVLSLVPDVHVCVLRAGQVVDGVPAAIRPLADGFRTTRRPVTFISGPSATVDIEFQRVEGVHGPRQFDVLS